MHATIHQFRRSLADEREGWGTALAEDLHGTAPVGSCTLTQLAGLEGCVVAFWATPGEAAVAVDHRTTDGPVWLDATAYEVVMTDTGRAADQSAVFVQVTAFDGPRSRAQAEAADRAGRDRIWPALKDLPGLVRVHVLTGADRSEVVLCMATGVETLEAVQRTIMSTQLLPDEDPALLSGPDRLHLDRVVAARLPALATTGSAS